MYVGASTVPGIGMPICLISAELVAKRLLGATTVSPLPTPAPPGFLARSIRRGVLGDIARRAVVPGTGSTSADDAGTATTAERA
jgi:hypothetical protein